VTKKIKQVTKTNTYNTLHKRHQYNLKQIETLLEQNNLMIAKADRGRTVVIIHKDIMKQKFVIIIPGNRIIRLNKDPEESFQNDFQQTMHKCNTIIDKNLQKFLVQKKPLHQNSTT
jgi:hypothetical protein